MLLGIDPPRTPKDASKSSQSTIWIWSHRLLPWVLYVGAAWALLYPLLVTAIVADDYLNPFYQFQRTGFSPTSIIRYSWDATRGSGHFNYLGQIVGNAVTAGMMFLMSVLGIRYSTTFAVTKLVVFVLTALSASAFTRVALNAVGHPQHAWRCRTVISVLLFGTLQLHIAWSNDPVGGYPMAGFGSVALGFLALTYGLKALLDRRYSLIAIAIGIAAILYYELNVATTAALLPAAAWLIVRERQRAVGLVSALRRHLPLVALPGIAAVVLQLGAAPNSGNYGGTAVESDPGRQLTTFWMGFVGGLPGSSWALTREWINRPIALQVRPVIIFVVVITGVLFVVTKRWEPIQSAAGNRPALPLALVLSIPIVYWLIATFIQCATQKVQDETDGIGYVYTYYAVAATAVAVIVGIGLFVIPWARLPRLLAQGLMVTGLVYVFVQLLVNWNLSMRFNEATLPNQALLLAFSEQEDVASRCTALINWTGGAWPDYYEDGMVEGLLYSYRYFHGDDFCPNFRR